MDPLANMMLSSGHFRTMTEMVMEAAAKHCGGRIVMTHEGGYSAPYVPYCGLAVVEALSGIRSDIPDPWGEFIEEYGGQALQAHQAAVIDAAKQLQFGVSA
jgi:acetoin utilization deacetylase AcuC-like enzyme